MLFLKTIFIVLHVITAAAWFGMGLRMAAQARTVLRLERPAALALAEDVQRTIRFMGIFIVLTLLFAAATFGTGVTMMDYGMQFHIAFLLIFILVGLQYGLIRPSWNKLRNAIEAGENAEALRKRISMSMGIGQLVWLILLILMFWDRFYLGG